MKRNEFFLNESIEKLLKIRGCVWFHTKKSHETLKIK